MDKILHYLIYLNYGIYGTIIYLGHAGFCPSTVLPLLLLFAVTHTFTITSNRATMILRLLMLLLLLLLILPVVILLLIIVIATILPVYFMQPKSHSDPFFS